LGSDTLGNIVDKRNSLRADIRSVGQLNGCNLHTGDAKQTERHHNHCD